MLLHKLQNHLLSLSKFSGLKTFSEDYGMESISGRQIILCFSSFEEEEKQKALVIVLITEFGIRKMELH